MDKETASRFISFLYFKAGVYEVLYEKNYNNYNLRSYYVVKHDQCFDLATQLENQIK